MQAVQPTHQVHFHKSGLVSKYDREKTQTELNLDNFFIIHFQIWIVYWQTFRENQTQTCSIIVGGSSKATFITPIFITVTFTNSTDISLSKCLHVNVVRNSLVIYKATILKPLTHIDTFLLFVGGS